MNTTLDTPLRCQQEEQENTTTPESLSQQSLNQEEPGPTSTDIAWAAGLFEGEGWISFRRKKPNLRCIGIEMTDEDVMERFMKVVNYGRLIHKLYVSGKTAYRWQTSKHTVVAHVLKLFLPYLGTRRSERANEVLRHYETTY